MKAECGSKQILIMKQKISLFKLPKSQESGLCPQAAPESLQREIIRVAT